MFGKSFTMFRLFGFTVRFDLSWLVVLVLVIWSLAGGMFPGQYPGLSGTTYVLMAIAAAAGLFGSVVFHELCHSLVARRFGMRMEGITLFLLGGVAEMGDEPPTPKAEFLMAAAGPAASVLATLAFLAATAVGERLGWPVTMTGVLLWVGILNLVLAAFNLIPGFPLDGGRMLRAALWHFGHDLGKATRIATRIGSGFGAVLIALGIFQLLLLNPLGGLWWILIGMFVRGAAKASYRQLLVRQALGSEPVRSFMNAKPVTVPPFATVEQLVEDYVYRYHHKMFPVTSNGRVEGCVTTRDVGGVPRERWSVVRVADIARECSEENTVGVDENANEAFQRMSRHGQSRLMVLEGERLVGILALRDMMRFLTLKLQLEGAGAETRAKVGSGT